MLVNSVSIKIGYLLLITFNGYLVNGEKGGANIVVQGRSEGHGGGGSVIVNSPKKGPQNIVVRDYRGTVVLNSHKKGGANIVINSHEEKKPHHSHHHHPPHHHQAHHGYESPKMMPMLGESGSSSASSPAYGSRTVKPYESEEVGEEQVEPTVARKRKGNNAIKLKKKTKIIQEQSDTEEGTRPKIRGRAKGDSDEAETEPEEDSSDAYSPSNAEEHPYSNYRDRSGSQSGRKGLKELEKGIDFGVDSQIEQQIGQDLLGQLTADESSDSGSSSSGSSSGDTFGLTGDSDSAGYFTSSLPSSDTFNSDTLKGLSLSDALFGSDKDTSSAGSGLLDLPWSTK
ncbi:uncharacterized protein LOC112538819 [Tetranychus urticae]|uniref:uncharacterized protein LOC112538819 n=1 Tax=Tetranychus urticae TaxID=32264 RepID=UPI000D64184B|nr:uncharacterized protein LOC112538819 [Tetranychus urticae]